MRTSLTYAEARHETASRNVSNPTTGRAFAARIARATQTDAELWLAGPALDLAADLADLTGVDAELWEQRVGESRESYLDRASTAILITNPELPVDQADELAVLVAEAVAVVVAEAARYRLLMEAGRIERERCEREARAQASRERKAARVAERLARAAEIKAQCEELDRTAGQPDDTSWSAAELRGVQRHSPFRNGTAVYRFRRSDGTLAPVVA